MPPKKAKPAAKSAPPKSPTPSPPAAPEPAPTGRAQHVGCSVPPGVLARLKALDPMKADSESAGMRVVLLTAFAEWQRNPAAPVPVAPTIRRGALRGGAVKSDTEKVKKVSTTVPGEVAAFLATRDPSGKGGWGAGVRAVITTHPLSTDTPTAGGN